MSGVSGVSGGKNWKKKEKGQSAEGAMHSIDFCEERSRESYLSTHLSYHVRFLAHLIGYRLISNCTSLLLHNFSHL